MANEPEAGSGIRRVGDLEINQDLAFQRRTWVVERAGWAAMSLLVLGGLLGLFGGGPLSSSTTGTSSGLVTLEYPRFARLLSPMTLEIALDQEAAREDAALVWLDRDYLADVAIKEIVPSPDAAEVTADGVLYRFRLGREGSAPANIYFSVEPETIGIVRGRVRVAEEEPLTVRHFVYP